MAKEEVCCPRFDPTGWDEKTFEWDNKLFIKGRVRTFLFMPIGYGRVMTRLHAQLDSMGAKNPDYLCLSVHTSKWNQDIYLATDKEILGAENVSLSGKYISKVYEGPFQDTGKWVEDFEAFLKDKGLTAKTTYMWYTTCPKCAKKYGKNYVVILAEI